MANYEFTRLSDVPVVETVQDNLNVLVEQDGEIGKVAKTQIGAQADWNETDETSPAFILNKPEVGGGGSGTPIVFYISNGLRKGSINGELAEIQEVVDAYFSGNAHVWAVSPSIGYVPNKIVGFGISNNSVFAKYVSGNSGDGATYMTTQFTPTALETAINTYFE